MDPLTLARLLTTNAARRRRDSRVSYTQSPRDCSRPKCSMPRNVGIANQFNVCGRQLRGVMSAAHHAFFCNPSAVKSITDGRFADTGISGPLRNSQGLSTCRKKSVVGLVAALLQLSSPAAIFFRVTFGIADSLKSFAVRTGPHVIGKITETISPARAYANAFCSVVLPARISATVAS